jgi:hypothetical protein
MVRDEGPEIPLRTKRACFLSAGEESEVQTGDDDLIKYFFDFFYYYIMLEFCLTSTALNENQDNHSLLYNHRWLFKNPWSWFIS